MLAGTRIVLKLVIFVWLYKVTHIVPELPLICVVSDQKGEWR